MFDLGYLGRYPNGDHIYEGASRRYPGDRIQVKIIKDNQNNEISCSGCVYTFNIPSSFPFTFQMNVNESSIQVIEIPSTPEII